MPGRNIVVVGGSMGGLEAARTLLGGLPHSFPASVFIVLHTAAQSPGFLAQILARSTTLPCGYPEDLDPIRAGHVYIAPPDRHLLVKRGHIRVTRGPRENRFRPAVDPLFRTAAVAHQRRVIGVVLSGGQDDGAVGIGMIKSYGGLALVQDPHEAVAPGMPQAALRQADIDYTLPIAEIPRMLDRLVREPVEQPEVSMTEREPRDVAEVGAHNIHRMDRTPPSPFTCPECGGALWESRHGALLQFTCHIGHRYSGDSLVEAQTEELEQALWAGLRALEESSELRRRMADHARERGMVVIATSYDEHANESEQRASLIRRVLMPEAREIPGDMSVGAEEVNDTASALSKES
jgi:two-component system chemotaxis response regulator CheB